MSSTDRKPLLPYNVVLMTAVVVTVMAEDELTAAQTAVAKAGEIVNPLSCRWVAKGASLDPIQIAEPGETEEDYREPLLIIPTNPLIPSA